MTTNILMAIGFVCILEGLIPALFPNKWQAYIKKIAAESPSTIRTIGLIMMTLGAVILFINH